MSDKVTPIDKKRRQKGGRPSRKEKIEHLERENEELRERIGLEAPRTLEDWELVGTQELRDAMAVRALIAEWNDPFRALVRLGFTPPLRESGRVKREEYDALIQRIFKTPGVERLLAEMTRDLEENKPELIRRQMEIAQHGDADASVRAFSQLSKIAGWQKTPDTVIDNRRVNLYTLVGGEAAKPQRQDQEALPAPDDVGNFLAHEPGEAVRIVSDGGDAIDAAFREAED